MRNNNINKQLRLFCMRVKEHEKNFMIFNLPFLVLHLHFPVFNFLYNNNRSLSKKITNYREYKEIREN